MAINFPDSPANNDQYTIGSTTWMYNGTAWVVSVGDASIATGAITTDKIAAGAVTAAKLGNDISLTPADGSISAAKIASDAVTTAKILDLNVTTAKVAANAITQAKLAANVSGITITTTANRGTDVASPFTGQTIFLSDVTRLQVWNGSAWTFITNGAPGAPTSLSATALSATSVSVAFTTGTINGASPTNYKYSLSTNGGSTYGEPTALDPADIISPVTISGLTESTSYLIKLRAVSDFGDSVDSSPVSITTLFSIDYLVIAGGGGGGAFYGGGGGAGGYRTNMVGATSGGGGAAESALALNPATTYTITVGAGGAGTPSTSLGSSGVSSSIAGTGLTTITSTGGGGGGFAANAGLSGGSGGGGGGNTVSAGGSASPASQGFAGGAGSGDNGGGGGGAGETGNTDGTGHGGDGLSSSITGTAVTRGGGGAARLTAGGLATGGEGGGGTSGNVNGVANTGGGGGAAIMGDPSGPGGSGVVILRYPSTLTITIGAGLTGTTATVSSNKVTTITAGSGNVSWSA